MTAPPKGDRLSRLERAMKALARAICGLKSEVRALRADLNRLMIVTTAMWITTMLAGWASVIIALLKT